MSPPRISKAPLQFDQEAEFFKLAHKVKFMYQTLNHLKAPMPGFGRGGGLPDHFNNKDDPMNQSPTLARLNSLEKSTPGPTLTKLNRPSMSSKLNSNTQAMAIDNQATAPTFEHIVTLETPTQSTNSTTNSFGFHPAALLQALLKEMQSHDANLIFKSATMIGIDFTTPNSMPNTKEALDKVFPSCSSTRRLTRNSPATPTLVFTIKIASSGSKFWNDIKAPVMEFLQINKAWLDKPKGMPQKMVPIGFMAYVHPQFINRDQYGDKISTLVYNFGLSDDDKSHFPMENNKPIPFLDFTNRKVIDPKNPKTFCNALVVQVPETHRNIIYEALIQMQGQEGDERVMPDDAQFTPFLVRTENPALYTQAIKAQAAYINNLKCLSLIGLSETQLDTKFKVPGQGDTTIRAMIHQYGINLQRTEASDTHGIYRLLFPKKQQAEMETAIKSICDNISKYHPVKAGITKAVPTVRLTNASEHKTSPILKSCMGQLETFFASNPQDDDNDECDSYGPLPSEEEMRYSKGYFYSTSNSAYDSPATSYAAAAGGKQVPLPTKKPPPPNITVEDVNRMIDHKMAEHTKQQQKNTETLILQHTHKIETLIGMPISSNEPGNQTPSLFSMMANMTNSFQNCTAPKSAISAPASVLWNPMPAPVLPAKEAVSHPIASPKHRKRPLRNLHAHPRVPTKFPTESPAQHHLTLSIQNRISPSQPAALLIPWTNQTVRTGCRVNAL